ncbi:MAG: hypothetical protein JO180_10815 [Gemmatirosa sp.]|nr:hypothetical protein [Gemmatirosa sp.]
MLPRALAACSLAGSLAIAACASRHPDDAPAATGPSAMPATTAAGAVGDTLRVMRGQSVSVDGGRLVIHVDSASDSRCPQGVQCVWSGEVTAFLRLEAGGTTASAAVHSMLEPKHATHAGYDVAVVGLTPYPGTEPPNARLAQVALLMVTRR